MSIEVKIDAEKVQDAVVAAIVNSTIGKELEKAIGAAMKPESFSTRTLVEKAVEEELKKVIICIVREQLEAHREQIRATTYLTHHDQKLSEIFSEMLPR